MVAHPMVALLLLPLNQSLALQPLGLRLEKARQLTPRPQVTLSTGKQKNLPLTAGELGKYFQQNDRTSDRIITDGERTYK